MSATQWLRPVADALAGLAEPVRVFVRDDDGGWHDERLMSLLDVCAAREVAVDVAMIPADTRPSLARALAPRASAMRLGLHQHGYDHSNHEPTGRKCEFGPARTIAQIEADIARGQRVLRDRLGDLLDPVFTPPWNRCVPEIATVLRACGLRVLSRDRSAGLLDHPGLREVPVSIDWFGGHKGVRWSRHERGTRIAAAIASGEPVVGLMLHHAVTDSGELVDIDALLALLGTHEQVQMTSIMDLASQV